MVSSTSWLHPSWPHSQANGRGVSSWTAAAVRPASIASLTCRYAASLRAIRSPWSMQGRSLRRNAFGGALAQARQRAADQPRDLHLRDADALGDLRLRQVLDEAQVQDAPVTLVEHAAQRTQHGDLLRAVQALVLDAERVAERALAVVERARGGVQRHRRVGRSRLQRLERVLQFAVHLGGDLVGRRRTAVAGAEPLDRLGGLQHPLLQRPRDANGPRGIAQVAAHLAG